MEGPDLSIAEFDPIIDFPCRASPDFGFWNDENPAINIEEVNKTIVDNVKNGKTVEDVIPLIKGIYIRFEVILQITHIFYISALVCNRNPCL